MLDKLNIQILTPYGKYLETQADYLSVVSTNGVLGILPSHSPLITKLEISKMVIKNEGVETVYAISGGLMNVKKNSEVVILANTIENANDIDINRAEESKKRAESRLNSEECDITRAKASLARALNRIEVFNYRK